MKRTDFRFLDRLRVRWAEVDLQKIVFNGHYLMYFDTAVSGYWRALAMPYASTMLYLGGDLFVRKATLEYEGSARFDDVLDLGIRCARVGNSSMVFSAAAFRQDQLLVSAELVYVFADAATQGSRPVPQELRELLQDFEAGKPMVEVRVGRWAELGRDAQRIRTEVFVDEQRIPPEREWGRRRCRLPARRRLQPFRRGPGHRAPAGARAGGSPRSAAWRSRRRCVAAVWGGRCWTR